MDTTTAEATASTFTLPENVGLAAVPPPPLEGRAMNPVPGWMDVLREQLGAVGIALRREAFAVGTCLTLFTGFVFFMQFQHGTAHVPLSPVGGIAAALAALLLPMAVWKGEDPGRRGYHLSMPVEHGPHAIAKGAAGLAWTLAGVAGFFVWMGLLSLITGGGVDHVEPWQWLAPFAGAAVLYLLGSALTLVTSRPWRWMGLGLVGYLFLGAFRGIEGVDVLTGLVETVITGQFGLRTLLGGQTGFSEWLTAVWVWLATSVSLFLVAAHRQPEQ